MEKIRAALLGCLLTGGVIFGARPILPEQRPVRPVVYSAGPGNTLGRTPTELARWFRPPSGEIAPIPLLHREPQTFAGRVRRCTFVRARCR